METRCDIASQRLLGEVATYHLRPFLLRSSLLSIVADSSTLRELSRELAELDRVGRLLSSGRVRLVIPEIVVIEVAGGLADDALLTSRQRRESARLGAWVADADLPEWHQYAEAVASLPKISLSALEESVRSRLEAIGAVVEPSSASDLGTILREYADGAGAFGTRRSRTDLPDAIILDTIRRTASASFTVALTADKRLSRATETLPNVVHVPSFRALFNLDAYRSEEELILRDLEDAEWTAAALTAVEHIQAEFENSLAAILVSELDGETFHTDLGGPVPTDFVVQHVGRVTALDVPLDEYVFVGADQYPEAHRQFRSLGGPFRAHIEVDLEAEVWGDEIRDFGEELLDELQVRHDATRRTALVRWVGVIEVFGDLELRFVSADEGPALDDAIPYPIEFNRRVSARPWH